jgi:RNA polymerase sigma-B factor
MMKAGREAAKNSPALWNERELWHRREEPAVRSELARRFLPLARRIARRYKSRAERSDDIVQVASLGLMNAIQRFDPTAGSTFPAFASPTINGELKRHFRDRVSTLRLPRSLYERIGRIESATSELRGRLGREPSEAEVAEATDCTRSELDAARVGVDSRHPETMQRDDDSEGHALEERIGETEKGYGITERRMTAGRALKQLNPRDRDLIGMRYRERMSQSQIADRIGCSQMQVSRRLKQVLNRLNDMTREPGKREIPPTR